MMSRVPTDWGFLFGTAVIIMVAAISAGAQELVGLQADPDTEYSAYIEHEYPNQVLFGDTHLDRKAHV